MTSFALETAQYAFAIGAADVTDLITNTAGAAVGVGFYGILSRIVRDTDKLNRALNVIALIGMTTFLMLFAVILLMN